MWNKRNFHSFFDRADLAVIKQALSPKAILGESSHQVLTMILGPMLLQVHWDYAYRCCTH